MSAHPCIPEHRAVYLNFSDMIASRADGVSGKITNVIAGQDETDDPDCATACVVGWDDGLWGAVNLSLYEKVRTN